MSALSAFKSKLYDLVVVLMATYLALFTAKTYLPYSIGYNVTHSIPLGIYFQKDYGGQSLSYGDIVCFKYVAPAWAVERDYVPTDRRVCKPLAAKPGDTVKKSEDGYDLVKVSGATEKVPVLKLDTKGRDLPQGALPEGEIPPANFIVISHHAPNSLDSRYLGYIPTERVTHQIWPLITW